MDNLYIIEAEAQQAEIEDLQNFKKDIEKIINLFNKYYERINFDYIIDFDDLVEILETIDEKQNNVQKNMNKKFIAFDKKYQKYLEKLGFTAEKIEQQYLLNLEGCY